MSIETVAGLNSILKNHDVSSWVKKKGVETFHGNIGSFNIPGENKTDGVSFSDLLNGSIAEVNKLQKDADKAIQRLVVGENKNLHETMLAVERAEIAFKTMNQIRLKVIDAYREIMRMQI